MRGVCDEKLGPVSFAVRLEDGHVWKRHIDHLLRRPPSEAQTGARHVTAVPVQTTLRDASGHTTPNAPNAEQSQSASQPPAVPALPADEEQPPTPQGTGPSIGRQNTPPSTPSPAPNLRRSKRARKAPERLDL